MEIAQAIEGGISAQSALLTTLSLAIIGALFGTLLQVRIHNASHNATNQINLSKMPLFWLAIAAAGLSICLGYLISGSLIQYAPVIFSHDFEANVPFTSQEFAKPQILTLRTFSLGQFLIFAFSVSLSVIFIFCNRK